MLLPPLEENEKDARHLVLIPRSLHAQTLVCTTDVRRKCVVVDALSEGSGFHRANGRTRDLNHGSGLSRFSCSLLLLISKN